MPAGAPWGRVSRDGHRRVNLECVSIFLARVRAVRRHLRGRDGGHISCHFASVAPQNRVEVMTVNAASNPPCPSCGTEVPPDAPRGYCLKCLFALGTAEPASLATDSAVHFSPLTSHLSPPLRSFGDYELLEEIARGGMGVVYKARQKSLGRVVAVKMLLFGEQSGKELAQRFRAEAAAAASLQHPNIVAIHEVSAHEGQPFFAMDFVDGQSLAELSAECEVRKNEWLRRAARYVKIVAEAIHYAHERGILHRDLKPSNVLIDPFDQPRVTDFGLAKRLHHDSELTLSGQVLGSPNYMPPEQAAAKRGLVGRRSDVYSLGAILYHLLTGRPPFLGETLTDTLQEVLNTEPVSLRALNPSVPPDLQTLCLKCLEKEPGRRYPTALALAADLDRFLRDEPVQAHPVGPAEKFWRWCRRKPALAALGAATLLLLLAVAVGSPIAIYRINHERQRAEKGELAAREGEMDARQKSYASDMKLAQQAIAQNDFGRALELLDRHRPGRMSNDEIRMENSEGQSVRQSKFEIRDSPDLRGWEWRYLWGQCQGEERFILGEHTNGATAVGLLADGKTVFSAGKDRFVRLWDLESRRQIGELPHAEEVIGAAASPDGRWLATASAKYAEGQPVLLWDLPTRTVAAILSTNFWLRKGSITFSPDSRWLAFATQFGGVRLWDVRGRCEVTNLPAFNGSSTSIGLAFSPDSRTLAYNQDEHGAILLLDILSGSIAQLIGHQDLVRSLAFSPDGQTLASGSQDRTVRLWNLAEGRERLAISNHPGGVTTLAFSPDGRTLAMSVGGSAGRMICLVKVETGTQRTELRGPRKSVTGLSFTPDGRTLLSASDDGTVRVWDSIPREKEKSGRLFAPNSISTDWRAYGPALFLSPDGRHLVVVYTNQTFSLWDTLRLREGERHPLPFSNTTTVAVAPNGRLAAFASRDGEVRLWDAQTGQMQFFARPGTNSIHRLVFSLDGRSLAAADNTKPLSQMGGVNERSTIRVWEVDARKKTHVISIDYEFPISLRFSADGRTLMAGYWKGSGNLWLLDHPGNSPAFSKHPQQMGGMALLPDGQTMISAGGDIRFWDVQTRRETRKLNPRTSTSRIALGSDGRFATGGGGDGSISIWDATSHQEVARLEGHKEDMSQLSFTPDGDYLISVSKEQLRFWRAPSWAEIKSKENRE
jgi:eukaryotic-like serine/threonine-protein kinase